MLPRSTVAALLEQLERVPARSVADVRAREELRRSLRLSAAARVGALLAAADTPTRPQMSGALVGQADPRPFGDELTTEQAAERLGVSARQVGRRCHFDPGHPDALRSRRRRGALVVSGFDVAASAG